MSVKISIVIPTKNGGKTIEACLKAIYEQTLIAQTEVIIIDSGSTDNTLEIVKKYPIRLYEIPPSEFGHGKTRNLGVSLSKGEFVLMTVQDAQAASTDWLKLMLQHFVNEEVVAVCGQQAVPHKQGINPVQWFRPVSAPGFRIIKFSKAEFHKLSPKEQWQTCRWDDVNAMYRKSVLETTPFQNVEFGEDLLWAKQALSNEYTLVYDSRSIVWHYHHYTKKKKIIERITNTYNSIYNIFKYIPPNSYTFESLIKRCYICLKYRVKPYWWFYNLRLHIVSYFAVRRFTKNIEK